MKCTRINAKGLTLLALILAVAVPIGAVSANSHATHIGIADATNSATTHSTISTLQQPRNGNSTNACQGLSHNPHLTQPQEWFHWLWNWFFSNCK